MTVDELIDSYKPMIIKLAKKWKNEPRVTEDDLKNEGRIAVYRALIGYDESKGSKLSTYIYSCINNAMKAFFQKNRYVLHSTAFLQKKDLELIKQQERAMVNIDKPITYNKNDQLYIKDIVPSGLTSPENSAIIEEERKLLINEINKLSKRDRYIIKEYNEWFGDKTLEEIGNELGITRQRVAQCIKQIKDSLRNSLEALCEN